MAKKEVSIAAVQDKDDVQRSILPIPDPQFVGLTTYDAKDPNTKYPPIKELRPPKGSPNILIVLIDDAGFGSSSAFGGPCNTPNIEKLAYVHQPDKLCLQEGIIIQLEWVL